MKGVWFSELQAPGLAISCQIQSILHQEKTAYQEIQVLDTVTWGRVLTLDNVIQTSTKDEFVYHEMISLVPLNTHPAPERVLVIGGGDGGAVREAVRHPRVKEVTLAEIDSRVIEAASRLIPETACTLDHPKVKIRVGDGIEHLKTLPPGERYDVIIVDSTDPVGPAEGLFSKSFYRLASEALRDDGIFVAQTESPFLNQELIRRVQGDLARAFPIVRLYLATIPTYPGGLWTFSLGSKRYDPLDLQEGAAPVMTTRYYSPAVHLASFVLPPFVAALLPPREDGNQGG